MSDSFNDITLNNEIANQPVGVPSDQFNFQTIADLEIPADLEAFDSGVDPEYEAMLANASDQINRYFVAPTSNYYGDVPPAAIGRYNPAKQSSSPDMSTMEGKIRGFNDISKVKPIFTEADSTFGDADTNIADPVFAGIAESQFDRYYASGAFGRLGFHAHRNNEEFYNQNSSGWEDAGRMFGQLTHLIGTGAASSYRSWFEDDVMDLKSAIEYEDAVRIGSSSRDGFGAGVNNFVLNAGYTIGIIGSIALEELIMWGATAALAAATPVTAGASGAAAVATAGAATARTAFNMAKLWKAFSRIGQSFKIGKAFRATKDFVQGMKKIEKVRDLWGGVKAGDNILGRILMPETMSAFKQLNTAKKAGENIHGMMKFSKRLGGVYRDLRSLNFAISEGRMEGGSVYKEQWQKNYLIAKQENKEKGLGELSTEQLVKVNEMAKEAAFATTMFNAPVIYLSNQLLLGNAFGGFKRSFNQIAREGIEAVGGRIVRKKAAVKTIKDTVKKQVGKEVKEEVGEQAGKKVGKEIQEDIYEGVEDSFLNWKYMYKKIKSDGLRGGIMAGAAGALRYTVANISEGLQEVYQEAVSSGIKDYYTSIAFDPGGGGYDMFGSSMKHGMMEQFSGQGLETFMSGFFMGGVVGLPQKAIFQGLPTLYQIATDKAAYDAHIVKKKETLDTLVDFMNKKGNDLVKDPTSLFGVDKMNFLAQKQASEGMELAQLEEDVMNFFDNQDYANFHNLSSLMDTGKMDFFKEQLEDYLELTDQELAEAFPSEKRRALSGKLRQKIQQNIINIDKMEENYNDNKDRLEITANPSQYTPGSKEHEEESLRYLAQSHARYLYLFTKDGFQKAAERTEKIYQKLESHPIIKELSANDLTVLLTKDSLMEEIDALKQEVAIMGDPGSKRAKKRQEAKLKHLEAIASVLYDEKLQKKGKGKNRGFDRRSTKKRLTPQVVEYLRFLAKDKKSFVDNELVTEVMDMIVDHDHLSKRQMMYDKALRIMTDPDYMDDLIVRSKLYFKWAYNNKSALFKESLEQFVNKMEVNELLNQLANLGVYIDQKALIFFGTTGDPKFLDTFYNEDGVVNEVDHPKLMAEIKRVINVYKETASDALQKAAEKRAEEAKATATSPEERDKSVSVVLDEAGIEGPDSKIYGKSETESPYLDEVLKPLYVQARMLAMNMGSKNVPKFEEWIKTNQTASDVIRAYSGLKKLWYQTFKTMDEGPRMEKFHSDKGFKEWLELQQTNDLVENIIKEASTGVPIALKVFLPDIKQEQGVTEEDDKIKGKSIGNSVDIVKKLVIDPTTKVATQFWILLDKSGNLIDDAVFEAAGLDPILSEGFTVESKAEDARNKIANYVPVLEEFEFDGVKGLNYGDRIQDVNTKEWYVIVSNSQNVEKYGNLLVIKENLAYSLNVKQRIKKAEKLGEGQFMKRFVAESTNAGQAALPKNVSKLRVDEATAIAYHDKTRQARQDGEGETFRETETEARRRFDLIIKFLSPDELKQLEVVITKNPDAFADMGNFKYDDKNPNPFIKKTRSPYNIGLRIPKSLRKKVNNAIKEAEASDMPENNILGYIPNGNVVLFNKDGSVINPLEISSEQVKDLFTTYGSLDQAATDIQNNFAIQFEIMNQITEKIGDSDSITLSLDDIGGVDFFTTAGAMKFDGKDKSILDLNVQTVDGITIVLENTKGKDGAVATRFITDGERGEGVKIQKKVIAEMNEQNSTLYAQAQSKSRYVMIVKSNSGVYSYFPIKSNPLDNEGKASIAEALISKSQSTVKENVKENDVQGKKVKQVADLKFNVDFNKLLSDGEIEGVSPFYIASKPGYTFEVNVGANGSIFIRVYDRDLKQSHNISMPAEAVAEFAEFENKEKFIDALIDNYNNWVKEVDSSKKAFSKKQKFITKLKAEGQLNNDSFKISYPKNVSTEQIVESVTTQVSPNIRGASKLIVSMNGLKKENIKNTAIIANVTKGVSVTSTQGTFQPTEPYLDADGNPIPKGPPLMTSSDSTKGEVSSLEELTKEEFQEAKENDFQNLAKDQREYLAKRLSEEGEKGLTNRELAVLSSPMGTSIRLLSTKYKNQKSGQTSNAASPKTNTVQNDRASLIEQRKKVEGKIDVRSDKIRKDNLGKLKNSEIFKKIKGDKEIKKLNAELADIDKKLNNSANKISDNLNLEDIHNIDQFASWAAANLPDFITIDDIRTLSDNMKSGGERIGAFVMALEKIAGKEKIGGKLYIGSSSRYAYHEAFHAVFRLLLTKEQQDSYYKVAKKEVLSKLRKEGKNLKEEIERLKNGDIDKYRNWSQENLEKEYLEEYMADGFEEFKQNPKSTKTDSWIKSLFNKILEWIRNVLGRFNGRKLEALYKDISAGKFKSSKVASNPFTDQVDMGVTMDASKLLRYQEKSLDNGRKVYKSIPNRMGRAIVNSISARVLELEMVADENFNLIDTIEDSIDEFKALYDMDNAQYANVTTEQLMNLSNIADSFEDFRKDIVESVIENLSLYDVKVEMIEDLDVENEMEYGLRTTEQYDKDASQTGGFRSLSAFLRKYIGTTTLSEKDEFGNEYINPEAAPEDRVKIITSVDFGSAYSGFLKAAANNTDPVKILQQLYIFSQNNAQTKAVVQKLFGDLGLQWEGQLEFGELPGQTKNNLLFQAVLKGFENFKVDYLFLHTNTKDGQVLGYSAANRDDAHTQVEKWETEYKHRRRLYLQDQALKDEASDQLSTLLEFINPEDKIDYISDKKLAEISKDISQTISDTLGIKLHPDYIAYTIAGNIKDPASLTTAERKLKEKQGPFGPTPWQRQILDSKTDVITIEWDDIVYMKEQFDGNNDLMSQGSDEGVYNRLRRLGLGNSMFDETVGASVFKNPAGDLVYAHQLPTFHLKKIAQLNDVENNAEALQKLIEQDPHLAANHLLNNPAFIQMSKEGLLKVTRISGSKESRGITVDSDGGVAEKFDRREEGVVYGDYNPKQFLHALLSAYISGVNPKSGKMTTSVLPEGQEDLVALAPVLLRVIEASNTGDMVGLPVIKAVIKNAQGEAKTSDEAINAYIKNIETELTRIQTELIPETRTKELIPGYNATKDGQDRQVEIRNEKGEIIGYSRAFTFTNNRLVLTPKKQKSQDVDAGRLLDTEETVARLRAGTQKIFIKSEGAAAAMGFFAEGESTNLEITIGEQVKKKKGKGTTFKKKKGDKSTYSRVKLLGSRKVENLTINDVYEKLGDALSDIETKTHTHETKIGDNTYWVESESMRDFVEGKKEAYVYEIIEEDILELDIQQLLEKEKEAAAQEDFDLAIQIRDLINTQEMNFGKSLAKVARENAALPADKRKVLTLDDALKQIGKTRKDLENYISLRIDQEFIEFNRSVNSEFYRIDENGKPILDLPKFLSTGVERNSESTGSEAEFARSNQMLNLTGNRTFNLKQIFINDWINTSAMNDILLGDQAQSLKDAVDAVKRAKMQNAAYYSAASRISSPQHGILNPLQKISMFAVTDPVASSIHTGDKIDQADAQNWMTVKAFRYMWFGFGKLTDSQAKLLDKIEEGADISPDEIFAVAGAAKKQEMLNSKKLVYGDGKVFDKFSVIPLTKALTSRKDKDGNWIAKSGREELHNMRVKMEQYEQDQLDQGVDTVAIVAPLSALKMMKTNITPIDDLVSSGESIVQSESIYLGPAYSGDYMNRRLDYKSNEQTPNVLAQKQVMELDANYMGLQVLNPSNKNEIIDPTQIKTLITGEQSDDTEVWIDGKKTNIGKLRLAYNKSVSARLEQKYLDKRNLIFNLDPEYAMDQLHKSISANKITPDLLAFLQYAQTALKASQSSSQLLDFFSFDENGNANFDFAQDTPMVEAKFKQLFLSYFSKGVMAEKIPGTSAALLSDYGFKQFRKIYSIEEIDGSISIDRQEIIRTNDFDQNYSMNDVEKDGPNGEPLDLSSDDKFETLKQRVKKLKKGEFIIVKDRLRPDMKEYKDGQYTGIKYTESMMPAHSKEAYTMYDKVPSKSIPDVFSKMFGIRIPSQDNHSTINIRIVDFLPVVHGSTIVSARELVEVSGADFDIDKLYIQMKDSYVAFEATKERTKIYDVVVDMYEHTEIKDQTKDKEPLDVWVVDNLQQAQEQLNLIKEGGRGQNFGEITESLAKTKDGFTYYFVPHKRGDTKRIYIKGTEPKNLLVKDKLRTKGQPYTKAKKEKVVKEYKNNFESYVQYINKSVQKKGSTHAEALSKSKNRASRLLTDAQLKAAKKLGFSMNAIYALTTLNLPLTEKAFEKYAETTGRYPFSAGYNNEILDQKQALMGHTANTSKKGDQSAISYEPADMEILKEIWTEISFRVPELAEMLAEDGITADNLFGKWKGFANNKEGARGIGAAVLPNLFLSLLQENGGVKMKAGMGFELNLGGQIYNGLFNEDKVKGKTVDRSKELKEDGTLGRRKQYIISALITAMTDNAKERLAKKLGLGRNALAIVTGMTAMGVPIRTSILMMKHPMIMKAYELESRAPDFEFDVSEFIEKKMEALVNAAKEYGLAEEGDFGTVGVNESTLYDALEDPTVEFRDEGELESKMEKAQDNGVEVLTKEQILRDHAILKQFLKAKNISSFLRPLGDIMNLAKGFGQDNFDLYKVSKARKDLKLDLTDEEMNNLPPSEIPIFDLRSVFSPDKWQTTMLDIFDEFAGSLLPKVFLNESIPYNNIFEGVEGNFKRLKKEERKKVNKDLLSYITLQAYLNWLSKNPNSILGLPTNSLIYPEEGTKDIADVYEELVDINDGKYNYFLEGFVRVERATDEGNKTGISMISANTLTPLNDSQKVDVQNGFQELYADPVTRSSAMKILNYMIVKDGMQPVYKSIIAAISPESFIDYLGTLPATSNAFATMNENDILDVFGMSFRDLKLNFLKEYGLHPKTAALLKKRVITSEAIFNGKSLVTQSRGEFTKETAENNPDKLFIIFDNEAGNGTSNSKGARDASTENVIRLIIKKNAANSKENFYGESEMDDAIAILNAQIKYIRENSDSYPGGIVIQQEIDAAELDGLSKHSEALYDEVLSLMKNNFGYEASGLTDKQKKKETKEINRKAKNRAVYLDDQFEKATIIVNLEAGIKPKPDFEDGSTFKEKKYANVPHAKMKKYASNIKQAAFNFDTEEVTEGKVTKTYAIFPQTMAFVTEGKTRYFQLVRHAGAAYGQIGEGLSSDTASGTYAEYIEVEIMGSTAQTPIGFIFGERRTNAEIKEIVKEANPEEESGDGKKKTGNPEMLIAGVDYKLGSDPTLDQLLRNVYDTRIKQVRDMFTFEEWVDSFAGKSEIKKYQANISDPNKDITIDKGNIKLGGETLDSGNEGLTASVSTDGTEMTFGPSEETADNNIEADASKEDKLKGNGDREKLQTYLDELTPSKLMALKKLGESFGKDYGSIEALLKESKKSNLTMEEFIEELKNCF